jgi:hypothetical protein
MMPYVKLLASEKETRVQMILGGEVKLRATLPPLTRMVHERAVTTLLEAFSLWADGRVCVALSADDEVNSFRLGLTDELGAGARSVFFAVEVMSAGSHPKRVALARGDTREVRQLQLATWRGEG